MVDYPPQFSPLIDRPGMVYRCHPGVDHLLLYAGDGCLEITGCTTEVPTKILETAGRVTRFQMVINKHSPAAEEFRGLFDRKEGTEIIEAPDNAISSPTYIGFTIPRKPFAISPVWGR